MLLFLALNFKHQHGPRGSRVWPLHASDSLCPSGPCIFPGTVSRTERKKAQSPQHQLSNGVLEALTKQQQEASFFFLVLLSQSHTLSLSDSLTLCLSANLGEGLLCHCASISLAVHKACLISSFFKTQVCQGTSYS